MMNQITQTIDWLSDRAVASPQALALTVADQSWTYAELNAATDRFAQQLQSIGVQPGNHVGVLMLNRFEYVCLIHAIARVGAVLIPFNTRLTAVELEAQRSHVGCNVVICDANLEATAAQLTATIYSVEEPQVGLVNPLPASPKLRKGLLSQRTELNDISDHLIDVPPSSKGEDRDGGLNNLQSIVFTSGTTGAPKGVMLTFGNHFWSATASAFRLGLQQNDRWLSCIPLYHVGGLSVVFRSCLYGTAIDLHPRFDVEAIYRNLTSAPVTMISVVPTMLVRLMDRFGDEPWPASLRHILLGGAAATSDLLKECQQRALPISTTYGLTEVGSQAVTLTATDSTHKLANGGLLGSVGKPLMFTQIRIVERSEDGTIIGEAPIDRHGEIIVRGPTVMQGYYNNPEATARVLVRSEYGTELLTGDIGYLDHDGDLWVLQRRSDMIVSGGENIYPSEVESVLRSHPQVDDVCVVGIPDAEWGKVVAAMVVVSPPPNRPSSFPQTLGDTQKRLDEVDPFPQTLGETQRGLNEAELLAFARERLAGYKLPRRISFVDALPQTASGKVSRKEVEIAMLESAEGLQPTHD